MTTSSVVRVPQLRLLVGLDRRRVASVARNPTLPLVLGTTLPAVVLVSALLMLGTIGAPDAAGPAGGLTLGLLVAGPIAFVAYGLLFRGHDDRFLLRLGLDPRALFVERAGRLGLAALATVGGLLLPFAAAGQALGPPAAIGLAAAAGAVGTAAFTYAAAARGTATGSAPGWLSAGMRQWDPGLARAAALVYAPLVPFLGGAALGALAGAGSAAAGVAVLLGSGLAVGGVAAGGVAFGPAAPRFLPQVAEMAFSPPPESGGEGFRLGRGLSGLLPRRAAAVWVRDATVAGRRFAWASRVTWPVGIVSIAVLARWGETPSTRVWVVAAVGIALVVQAAAVIGLGIMERGGLRWLDRSGGLGWGPRFVGRWAWAWGMSLWLLVPVALAWGWWSGEGGAWAWPLGGALSAGVATAASLLNAERR